MRLKQLDTMCPYADAIGHWIDPSPYREAIDLAITALELQDSNLQEGVVRETESVESSCEWTKVSVYDKELGIDNPLWKLAEEVSVNNSLQRIEGYAHRQKINYLTRKEWCTLERLCHKARINLQIQTNGLLGWTSEFQQQWVDNKAEGE